MASKAASTGRSQPRFCSPRSRNAAPMRPAMPTGTLTRPSAVHKQRTGASAAARSRRDVPRRAARRSSTCATTRRATPPSPPTTIPIRHGADRRRPQRDHRERRRALRPARLRARRARDDRRLRGDLRARRESPTTFAALSRSSTARWRPPGSTSAPRTPCSPRAGWAGRSGSARAAPRSCFASTVGRARARRALHGRRPGKATRSTKGTLVTLRDGAVAESAGVRARPLLHRGAAPRRSRSGRRPLVPRAPRRARRGRRPWLPRRPSSRARAGAGPASASTAASCSSLRSVR